jgi:hypothetical protein
MTSTGRHCTAVSKSSKQPCKGYCMPGSDYCLAHDPKLASTRAEARRAGGLARHGRQIGSVGANSAPVELNTAGDVLALVQRAINDTLKLENSVARNRAIGTLALAALKAFEITDLAQRVATLEQLLAERQKNPYGQPQLVN